MGQKTIFQCDNCGREIKEGEEINYVLVTSFRVVGNGKGSVTDNKGVELCHRCAFGIIPAERDCGSSGCDDSPIDTGKLARAICYERAKQFKDKV